MRTRAVTPGAGSAGLEPSPGGARPAGPGLPGDGVPPPGLCRLLGVFAHPDDETFCAGGTFARYAGQEAEIMVVWATRGEAGQIRDAAAGGRRTIAAVREAELRLACERLGVTRVQHPLTWIAHAQAAGYDVLLDAAAFAPANRLDLSRWHPDYVSLSFYRIFGYPTGIGALLARKPALAKLRRPWYAGGTITFSSVRAAAAPGDGFHLTPGPAGFEDGTVNYLAIPAVGLGLDHISSIGIETIHTRVTCLTGWLLDALAALRHGNGAPVVRPRPAGARP